MGSAWDLGNLDAPEVIAAGLAAFPLTAERLHLNPPTNRATTKKRTAAHQLQARFQHGLIRDRTPFAELGLSISPVTFQLLQLAALYDGIDRDTALVETKGLDPALLDRSARELLAVEVAVIEGGVLRVHPDHAGSIPLPLPRIADYLDGITSDRLALACKLWGVDGGTRKADRADALLAVLRDPNRIVAGLKDAADGTLDLLARVIDLAVSGRTYSDDPHDPPGTMSISQLLPIDQFDHHARARSIRVQRYGAHQHGPHTPLNELRDRLVLGGNEWGYSTWLWFDVLAAINGRAFPVWPTPPIVEPAPVDTGSSLAGGVPGRLVEIAEYLGAHPAEGKKSGDRRPPVKVWRTAAKSLGMDAGLGALLGELAADLGVIHAVNLPKRGRGRSIEYPVAWQPNPDRLAEFRALPAGSAWLTVFHSWCTGYDSPSELTGSVRRQLLVAVLRSLPEGTGLGRAALGALASARHDGLGGSADVDDILRDLVALGAVSPGAVVGLTGAARATTGGAEAVDEVLGGAATQFVVQPDHSVIAPPDLDPRVAAQLRRYADLESEGGASVWRISGARLARASTSTPPEVVAAFFDDHSSVPVPDAVRRFLLDAMTTAKPVTVAEVGCVITCDDAIAVIDAARINAAKLTVHAPGVATSPLTAAKVSEVLASKGVILAGITTAAGQGAENPSGDHLAAMRATLTQAWGVSQRDPNRRLDVPAGVGVSNEDLEALTALLITGANGQGSSARPGRKGSA